MAMPSAFLSFMAVGMVLMRVAMLRRGFGRRPIRKLPAMLVGATAGLVLLAALPGGMVRHVLSALLYGAGYSMLHTLLNARLMESVDPQRRGAAFGALLFAFDAGIGLGSFSLGWVIGHHGYRLGWALGALAMLAALPLALRLSRD
jgi:predicted MFS family arabinose efflux permease